MTFPLPAVLAALDLKLSDVSNWSRRGYDGTELPVSGRRGRARRVTIEDVVRFAIIDACRRASIPASRSAGWANEVVDWLEHVHFNELHLAFHADGEHWWVDDKTRENAPASRPLLTVTLHVRAIVDDVKRRLEDLREKPRGRSKRVSV